MSGIITSFADAGKGARDREAAHHQRQQCQQHRAKRITTTARAEPWRGDGNGGFTSAIFKGTGRPRLAPGCHARRAQQRILQARIAHWIAVQQSSSARSSPCMRSPLRTGRRAVGGCWSRARSGLREGDDLTACRQRTREQGVRWEDAGQAI